MGAAASLAWLPGALSGWKQPCDGEERSGDLVGNRRAAGAGTVELHLTVDSVRMPDQANVDTYRDGRRLSTIHLPVR